MAPVRTFIAVNLDDSLRPQLSQLIDRLASSKAGVKWVAPENTHVTLKFLGNVDEERLPEVFTACEKAASGFQPIALEVKRVGCFPNIKRPRVVWVGLEGDVDQLERLQRRVEAELDHIGFPKEDRRFKAHLTIGRVKTQKGMSGFNRFLEDESEVCLGSMRAGKISVMKSKTLPAGPIYTELKAIPLH